MSDEKGISDGLADLEHGRTRPLADIRADLATPLDGREDQYCDEMDKLLRGPLDADARRQLNGAIRALRAAREENERLERWVDDLQSGVFINCVYCGHQYGLASGAGEPMRAALAFHVESCEKHPLFRSKLECAALRTQLAAAREEHVELVRYWKGFHRAISDALGGEYLETGVTLDTAKKAASELATLRTFRREFEGASLTSTQLRVLADWMLQHGNLDSNGVCLTALLLRNKADRLDKLRGERG